MITVLKKANGFWLAFDSSQSKLHALINVDAIPADGKIIRQAIIDACQECAAIGAQPATVAAGEPSAVQQLKAEIAAVADVLYKDYHKGVMYNEAISSSIDKLRQLSAV